jgi:hypothetical protein
MAKYDIVGMPGDGIGRTVYDEAVRVLDAVGFDAEYHHADIGWEFWVKEGNPLPDSTIELLEKYKIGLFGAITSKPKTEAAKELSPELQNKGLVYFSPTTPALNGQIHQRTCLKHSKLIRISLNTPMSRLRKSRFHPGYSHTKRVSGLSARRLNTPESLAINQ